MKSCCYCRFLAVSVLLCILSACSQGTPTPTLAKPEPAVSPTPAMPTPALLPRDVTPLPDLGIVQGLLSMDGEPAAGRMMYLAKVIRPGDESVGMAALDPVNDPRVESDRSGYFCFLDVLPGEYALGINSPIGPVLIRGADEREIVVEVRAGQTSDLETVRIVPFAK